MEPLTAKTLDIFDIKRDRGHEAKLTNVNFQDWGNQLAKSSIKGIRIEQSDRALVLKLETVLS
jgi:hypothetical protein